METQRFSPPGPDPGLRGGDRDVFLRVWQRVMPEEREGCPITVERPAQEGCGDLTARAVRPAADAASEDFPTREDVPCLGSGGEADRERLQEFIGQELAHWRAYQMLARRGGQGGRMLAAMASGSRKKAKRLSAALFLISGIRFWPEVPPTVALPRSYFGALRELFHAEQNRSGAYRAAEEECRDQCLRALYLDLADESMECAFHIRTLLEKT